MERKELKDIFGVFVCDDETLKKYMKGKYYRSYKEKKSLGVSLDSDTAKNIASAIKCWALSNGATHYTHWFLPLSNKTAEKQSSFIEIDSNGKIIESFDEKALIKGEADASSFPNGGTRGTFEARGYTIWDYTSPVFIKENSRGSKVVYIPTAFCSYNGTALDEKTPLLRSQEKLSFYSMKILKMLGYKSFKKVNVMVGAEQEYFLIRTEDYEKRFDIKMTGRSLLGAKPVLSQEMCSHYYAAIDEDVNLFMNEVDEKLWKMGVAAKLQHCEFAPMQFELVPIFSLANISNDQNKLIMETIASVAPKYGFKAIFHEKPFSGVNGSGKHLNISFSTDTGVGLLNPKGDKTLFNLFYTAVISAVDKYADLIKLSSSFYANDYRLGGSEAPPYIMSVFVSDYILDLVKSFSDENLIKKNKNKIFKANVKTLTTFEKDFSDRNRTSPFAFNGNKFEFRMVGASQSLAWPTTCVVSAVSMILKEISEKLEKMEGNPKDNLIGILAELNSSHSRIIFNGNSYTKEWIAEAKIRGLDKFKDSLSIYKILDSKEIVELFTSTKILSKEELKLREITFEKKYLDDALLEAKILLVLLNKEVFTRVEEFIGSHKVGKDFITLFGELKKEKIELKKIVEDIEKKVSNGNVSLTTIKKMLSKMKEIRTIYDKMEPEIPNKYQPFPTYNDILF